uniref:C2H2-type domain-containing protein n=1 Tax=Romanomermis culicivorax TaxID=13658 RepID=A0A915L5Y2_ROMCU
MIWLSRSRCLKYANSNDDISINAFHRTHLVSTIFPPASSTITAASHFLQRAQPLNSIKHIFPQYSPAAGIFGCGSVPLITPPPPPSIGLALHLASTTADAPPTTTPSTSSGSNAKKYKCDVCHKAFSRSNTLVTHKRIKVLAPDPTTMISDPTTQPQHRNSAGDHPRQGVSYARLTVP